VEGSCHQEAIGKRLTRITRIRVAIAVVVAIALVKEEANPIEEG
jgi:hypothetical protein